MIYSCSTIYFIRSGYNIVPRQSFDCSDCANVFTVQSHSSDPIQYCPFCGTEMPIPDDDTVFTVDDDEYYEDADRDNDDE